jgi:hypothetical protein
VAVRERGIREEESIVEQLLQPSREDLTPGERDGVRVARVLLKEFLRVSSIVAVEETRSGHRPDSWGGDPLRG